MCSVGVYPMPITTIHGGSVNSLLFKSGQTVIYILMYLAYEMQATKNVNACIQYLYGSFIMYTSLYQERTTIYEVLSSS